MTVRQRVSSVSTVMVLLITEVIVMGRVKMVEFYLGWWSFTNTVMALEMT